METQSCLTVSIAEAPATTGIEQLMNMMQMFLLFVIMLVMLSMVTDIVDIFGDEEYE